MIMDWLIIHQLIFASDSFKHHARLDDYTKRYVIYPAR